MQIKQCANGHFFDQVKFAECPYCKGAAHKAAPVGVTISLDEPPLGVTVSLDDPAPNKDLQPRSEQIPPPGGFRPPVGWLICVEGSDKGCDYPLRAGINFIGSGETSDIRVRAGKDLLERHAMVIFDNRDNTFFLAPFDKQSAVVCNGSIVLSPVRLSSHDRIGLGAMTLMFVPLCGDAFRWETP